jgi:hypothetical protein
MLEILSGRVQHAGFKEGLSQRYYQQALPWGMSKSGSDPPSTSFYSKGLKDPATPKCSCLCPSEGWGRLWCSPHRMAMPISIALQLSPASIINALMETHRHKQRGHGPNCPASHGRVQNLVEPHKEMCCFMDM